MIEILYIAAEALLIYYLLYFRNKLRDPTKRYYFYSLLSIALWVFFDYLLMKAPSLEIATAVFYFVLLSVSSAFSFFYLCSSSFVKWCDKKCKLEATLPFIPAIGMILFNKTNVLIRKEFGFQVVPNLWELAWIATGVILVTYGLIILYEVMKKVEKPELKKKMRILLITLSLAVAGGVIGILLTFYGCPSSISPMLTTFIISFSILAFKK